MDDAGELSRAKDILIFFFSFGLYHNIILIHMGVEVPLSSP